MSAPQRVDGTVFLQQWVILCVALLVLGGFIAYTQFEDFRRIDSQERERLATQANLVERNLVPQLHLADRVIDGILHDLPSWQAQNDGFNRANRQLRIINDALIGIRPLLVMNADGTVIASSDDRLLGMNFVQREYFQTALKNPDPKILHVSAPFKTVLDTFVITLFRTIHGPDGEFGGIVIVSIVPEYFANLLDSVRYAPDMWAAIGHGDGKLFMMSPARVGLPGMDLAQSETFFARHLESGQNTSVYAGTIYATGDERMVAQRTIQLDAPPMDKPLVVAVTRGLEPLFAPWWKSFYMQSLSFGMLAALCMLGLWFMQRRHRNLIVELRQTLDSLRLKERYQRALLDNFPFAVWLKDTESRFLSVNAGFVRIFGANSPDDLINKNDFDIAPPDMAEGYRADDRAVLASRQKKNVEEEIPTEGTRKWFETYKAPVIDDSGELLGTVGFARDITERKLAADQIEHLAFYDPLTDLPNRRLLLDRLRRALLSSSRHNRYGALLLLDMDDFKTLNDTLGHDVGDNFLVEVANRLQASVREGDTVARQGGDEFVVILEDLNNDELAAMQAESVAVKIHRAIQQPFLLDLTIPGSFRRTRSYLCTSSIGIVIFRDASTSVDELMRCADTAMYQAKAAGRNTMRFFDPEMQAAVTARASLDNDLREAVHENGFTVHYQPQADGDGRITGAEALIRWWHPQRGMVAPLEFIPLAEATGLIQPIGQWVLKTACAQLAAWATQPDMAHLNVAVNVSARQFRHPDFVDEVLAVILDTGANPKRLKLELTESLMLDDVESIIDKMNILKASGVGFSVDDFGTGYSSLSYLKRLPLDQLKIDQSFVHDVLTDPNDAAIARTIVALGQSLGLEVIAEGVETVEQRRFLAEIGCFAYQGDLFSQPLPPADFDRFVQPHRVPGFGEESIN